MHVDVHGMGKVYTKKIGQHFVIGTRAMETTQNTPRVYDAGRSLKFRKALATHLNKDLKELCQKGKVKTKKSTGELAECKVAIGYENGKSIGYRYKRSEQKSLRFVGDWRHKRKGTKNGKFSGREEWRNTLSRLSTERALWNTYRESKGAYRPFGCAVQVELSPEFRALLYKENGDKTRLGMTYVPKLAKGFKAALGAVGACTNGASPAA